MTLGAVEISINTTSHVYQPLLADFLSISDPVDITSLKSVQMSVEHVTVKVGNFLMQFSSLFYHKQQNHIPYKIHVEKHTVQQYLYKIICMHHFHHHNSCQKLT
jgi:hypothetical protein